MKKLTSETNYKVAQEIGKLFDLKVVGVKGEDLINQINEKIDAMTQTPKAGKWYENKELGFKAGDVVDVTDGWAKGRMVQIEKPSAKVDAYKGYLINPKTGEAQGTLVNVDAKDIQIYIPTTELEIKEEVKEEDQAV